MLDEGMTMKIRGQLTGTRLESADRVGRRHAGPLLTFGHDEDAKPYVYMGPRSSRRRAGCPLVEEGGQKELFERATPTSKGR